MLKIGAISFINALPFFSAFIEKKVAFDGQFVFGTPNQINTDLEQGKIDIGLISSASFIANRDRYILLTNLGIGASTRFPSVCLYSKDEVATLSGKTIAIPPPNTTSTPLLQVLCKNFWHISPTFKQYPENTPLSQLLAECDAALLIGDACFEKNINPELVVTDLTQEWFFHTKKPFVYSLFATRCDVWMQEPELVRDFHQKLLMSYEHSQANFAEMLQFAHNKTSLKLDMLERYYKSLDYYLEAEHFQGLEHFTRLKN